MRTIRGKETSLEPWVRGKEKGKVEKELNATIVGGMVILLGSARTKERGNVNGSRDEEEKEKKAKDNTRAPGIIILRRMVITVCATAVDEWATKKAECPGGNRTVQEVEQAPSVEAEKIAASIRIGGV